MTPERQYARGLYTAAVILAEHREHITRQGHRLIERALYAAAEAGAGRPVLAGSPLDVAAAYRAQAQTARQHAEQWDALAAELEAFDGAGHHPDQGALL